MDEDVEIMQGQACAGRSDETEVARSLVPSFARLPAYARSRYRRVGAG